MAEAKSPSKDLHEHAEKIEELRRDIHGHRKKVSEFSAKLDVEFGSKSQFHMHLKECANRLQSLRTAVKALPAGTGAGLQDRLTACSLELEECRGFRPRTGRCGVWGELAGVTGGQPLSADVPWPGERGGVQPEPEAAAESGVWGFGGTRPR